MLSPYTPSFNFLEAKWGSCLQQQKALFVCVSASDALDWSAHSPARHSPSGKDGWIHDSFCNEEKKKEGESACERRNSQDHWEIIRWSSVVDLELNGIINQAKKTSTLLIHLLFACFPLQEM